MVWWRIVDDMLPLRGGILEFLGHGLSAWSNQKGLSLVFV